MTLKTGHSTPIAVAKLSNVPEEVATQAEDTTEAMDADNEHFPAKPPIIGKTKSDVGILRNLIRLAGTRVIGAAEDRDIQVRAVKHDVAGLVYEVQTVAKTLPPEDAQAFIIKMKLSVSEVGHRAPKADLEVADGQETGSVILDARSLGRVVTYYYEYSLDGLNWTRADDTHHPRVEIKGLIPGKTYFFRFRALVGDERRDYCTAIPYTVR